MIDKVKAIDIMVKAARTYHENLLDRNILIIYQSRISNEYSFIEMIFYKYNFLHLTGVEFRESNSNNKASGLFFDKCYSNLLSVNDFDFKSDGTSRLKLEILKAVVNLQSNAVMIGDYNNFRLALITEKVIGSVHACLGAIKNDKGYYIPNTALNIDVRKVVAEWSSIKAIYSKSKKDVKYTKLIKKSEGFSLDNLPKAITDFIDE